MPKALAANMKKMKEKSMKGKKGGYKKSPKGKKWAKEEAYNRLLFFAIVDPDQISQADVYHRLGSLEGKLDAAISQMASLRSDINIAFQRIRKIETQVNRFVGIGLVLTIIIPAGITYLASTNNQVIERVVIEKLEE